MSINAIDDRLELWRNPTWWNLLVLVPWVLGLFFSLYQWQLFRAIATRERESGAVVTSHKQTNHNRYGYTFDVDGHTYTGWNTPIHTEPQIGQHIAIYYDPQHPEKSSMRHFSENSLSSFGPIPLLLFGTGGLAGLILWKRRTKFGPKA